MNNDGILDWGNSSGEKKSGQIQDIFFVCMANRTCWKIACVFWRNRKKSYLIPNFMVWSTEEMGFYK